MSLTKSDCEWERMLPEEFRKAVEALPVCFMPLGTVEWHGEHNALGLDSLKAHTGGRALVSAQVKGWRTDGPWAAWQHLERIAEYGRLLAEGQFGRIQELAGALL